MAPAATVTAARVGRILPAVALSKPALIKVAPACCRAKFTSKVPRPSLTKSPAVESVAVLISVVPAPVKVMEERPDRRPPEKVSFPADAVEVMVSAELK